MIRSALGFLANDLCVSRIVQRAAIAAFAKSHSYVVVAEFYDEAVSGADPIAERPGFKAMLMLDRIAGDGVRCILVESPDRFARDLTVQLTRHDFLKSLGISLIPATAPDFFVEGARISNIIAQVCIASMASKWRTQKWNVVTPFCLSPL